MPTELKYYDQFKSIFFSILKLVNSQIVFLPFIHKYMNYTISMKDNKNCTHSDPISIWFFDPDSFLWIRKFPKIIRCRKRPKIVMDPKIISIDQNSTQFSIVSYILCVHMSAQLKPTIEWWWWIYCNFFYNDFFQRIDIYIIGYRK